MDFYKSIQWCLRTFGNKFGQPLIAGSSNLLLNMRSGLNLQQMDKVENWVMNKVIMQPENWLWQGGTALKMIFI